jgi:phosphohistidine phosphatase
MARCSSARRALACARSDWNTGQLADHARPLARRGQRAAEALAAHVGMVRPAPALVLCSTARRAQETLEPIRVRLPATTDVLIEDDLYGATAPMMLARLRRVPDGTPTVLLVGHNPGLEDLVRGLGREGDPALIARVRAKYPTGALATLAFAGPWKDVGSAPATLEAFVVPADLE